MIKSYGADSVRWFILSDSPPDKDVQWSNQGVSAAYKFLQKIYNLCCEVKKRSEIKTNLNKNFDLKMNSYVNRITNSINNFNLENVTLSNLYCEQGFKGQRENPSNTKTCPSTLVLMLVNSGSFNVSQGSKITSCPKNSIVLLDNSGPELEQFPSTELLSVSIPYDTKPDIYRDFKDICNVSIDAQVGWPSILKQFIQNLWAERNQLTPSNSRFLLEILDDMIVSS